MSGAPEAAGTIVLPAACHPVMQLRFGVGGNSLPHQREGWSGPEDGFAWSVGAASRLEFRVPKSAPALETLLELRLNPFVVPGLLPSQSLVVTVNGIVVGDDVLVGEGTVTWRIPERATGPGGILAIELRHGQARRPADLGVGGDTRQLGFAVRELRILRVPSVPRADITVLPPLDVPVERDAMGQAISHFTGLDPRQLGLRFEGLGHNCEFGLVQRQVGAEPISLLRFAGITLDDLLAGLRLGFVGVGDEVVVRTFPTGSGKLEFLVHDDRYRIGLHTFRTTDETSADEVHAEHALRLRFAYRQFVRWLRSGERIFLFQRPGQITESQARALLTLLQGFGPNALLFVDQSPDLPSGAVAQLGHGFFHGKLAQMAPAEDAGALDLPGWLSLCANAHRLWKASAAR